MSLSLVTARSRTRGKSPVEFNFQAVGRLQARKVMDKDGNPILVDADGNVVKYSLKKVVDKDGKPVNDSKGNQRTELPFENDSQGNPIAPEGTRFVEVDDVLTTGLTDNLQEVIDLFGALSEKERGYLTVSETDADGKVTSKQVPRSPLQMVIDSALDGYNYASRKSAAPVTEQVTEDELTPITLAMVEKGILSEQDATTWRRTMTGTAKLMEMNRLDFAKSSPQYKKLLASGWKPAEVAA